MIGTKIFVKKSQTRLSYCIPCTFDIKDQKISCVNFSINLDKYNRLNSYIWLV